MNGPHSGGESRPLRTPAARKLPPPLDLDDDDDDGRPAFRLRSSDSVLTPEVTCSARSGVQHRLNALRMQKQMEEAERKLREQLEAAQARMRQEMEVALDKDQMVVEARALGTWREYSARHAESASAMAALTNTALRHLYGKQWRLGCWKAFAHERAAKLARVRTVVLALGNLGRQVARRADGAQRRVC